jgi:UDP-3-O-[3-hydroxymyristoyl] glucosamine N-acyltransferase
VRIGRRARIGKAARGERPAEGSAITTIGKNAEIPDGGTVRRGTVIHTDVTAEQFTQAPRRRAPRRKPAAGSG